MTIAMPADQRFGVSAPSLPLDTSRFSVTGTDPSSESEEEALAPLKMTYGYSQEHRPWYRLSGGTVERQAHYGQAGRSAPGQPPSYNSFYLQAAVVPSPPAIGLAQRRAGRFILATNMLSAIDFIASPVLVTDKDQQVPERGCRFLQDPLFFTSGVFLKTPSRVAVLTFAMGLALMV
ncbi:MAG: hypothetical protein F6K00_14140 [Leptolyngbya sp. SIOISBB]|nr:hypothetical protein [Leptolyngbya sp. SIOISBB]